MKLIKYTPDPMGTVERAAAKCYNSNPTSKRAIAKGCYNSGHLSVFEHSAFTFDVSGISRACLAQLTRHRIGTAFTVRSQRYCDEKHFGAVVPPSIMDNRGAYATFARGIDFAREVYTDLLGCGVPKEDARYILPNACETVLTVTMDGRELMHFCNERLCARAQWEIRFLARAMREEVAKIDSDFAAYLVPKCEAHTPHICPESEKDTCGKCPTRERVGYIMEKYYQQLEREAIVTEGKR